ncbi:hypothetical protein NDU88_002725 [Pleurodeles waltl]|uniref:Uncharacterized protein n=1 Tax=Pleurodeles waltl TaxID=8319 RepID=A0AAV7MSH6_PLEWA|nr:hypothetical protein NDU88_002725 [Pleurodeles waltl]
MGLTPSRGGSLPAPRTHLYSKFRGGDQPGAADKMAAAAFCSGPLRSSTSARPPERTRSLQQAESGRRSRSRRRDVEEDSQVEEDTTTQRGDRSSERRDPRPGTQLHRAQLRSRQPTLPASSSDKHTQETNEGTAHRSERPSPRDSATPCTASQQTANPTCILQRRAHAGNQRGDRSSERATLAPGLSYTVHSFAADSQPYLHPPATSTRRKSTRGPLIGATRPSPRDSTTAGTASKRCSGHPPVGHTERQHRNRKRNTTATPQLPETTPYLFRATEKEKRGPANGVEGAKTGGSTRPRSPESARTGAMG